MCAWPLQSLNCAPFAKVPYLYGTRIWENVEDRGEMGFIRKNKCHQLMVVSKLGPNCPSCLLAAFTVSLTLLHYYIFQND